MSGRRWVLVAALLLALAAAACSEKADEGSAGGGSSTQAHATPTKPAGVAEGLDSLREFVQGLGQQKYKLVYEMTGTDPKSGKLTGTLTMAADPPKQLLGLAGDIGGKQATFVLLNDGSASYVCVDAEGRQRCLKGQSAGKTTIPLPGLTNVDQLLKRVSSDTGANVKPVKDQQIAGRTGKCWEIEGTEGKGTFCVDAKDGTLLLMDGNFGGSAFAMKAKTVGLPVEADFAPPYRVVELGN